MATRLAGHLDPGSRGHWTGRLLGSRGHMGWQALCVPAVYVMSEVWSRIRPKAAPRPGSGRSLPLTDHIIAAPPLKLRKHQKENAVSPDAHGD